jgi:hypothetical protein
MANHRQAVRTGQPSREPTKVTLAVPADLLAALDRFIAEDRPGASRSEAMLEALRAFAVGNGLMLTFPGADDRPAPWPTAANDD